MFKKVVTILALSLMALSLTACKKIKVFEEKIDTSGITTYKKNNLKNGLIYIKDGAVFMLPAQITVEGGNYFYFGRFDDIPTLYKGEVLTYADDTSSKFNSVELIRLESVGYTFGVYNGFVNADGEYEFRDNDVLESADSYRVFPHNDKTIRIISLDGGKLTKDMAVNGTLGAKAGFDAFSEHDIACYIGTHYYEGTIKNDVFTLVDFEDYSLKSFEQTKNGYLQIPMNSDMKSGYYYIANQGVFRYVSEERQKVESLYDIDYYEPLYSKGSLIEKDDSGKEISGNDSEKTRTEAKIQTYSVPIAEKKYDYVFTVTYDSEAIAPAIILTSPNGATYTLKEEKAGVQSITLAEVAIGEWTIKISDPTIKILSIGTANKEEVVATKEVTKTFDIAETKSSQKVSIAYTGKVLNAYVVDKNNEVTVITPKDKGVYEYTFDFIEAGTYKVFVVCTEDTNVSEIKMEDCSDYETEIIVVE